MCRGSTQLRNLLAVCCLSLVAAIGCANGSVEPAGKSSARPAADVLRLATTTSTRDSGLLDELLPAFQDLQGCRVDVIAVGTGAALKLAQLGDVDVVVVHARAAEQAFMKAGYGIRHEEFMYNSFVLLGPPNDPAGIRGVPAVAALQKIVAENQCFVSRGDDSGTHKREQSLWKAAALQPRWERYVESGQGMGPTLIMADEMQGYLLADQGTYLKFRNKIGQVPLVPAENILRNPYAAIVVNPERHDWIDAELANAFVDFLISAEAQHRIGSYQLDGQQLFFPTRLEGD